jgi:hypothetical protein
LSENSRHLAGFSRKTLAAATDDPRAPPCASAVGSETQLGRITAIADVFVVAGDALKINPTLDLTGIDRAHANDARDRLTAAVP